MIPLSKKFIFTNVPNLATFLGNIRTVVDAATCGEDYAWDIDRFTPGDEGELLIHSTGLFDNQNLYYSIKLRNPLSSTAHIHLCGQTGYSAGSSYDTQPGKFTTNIAGLPSAWNGETGGAAANYVTAPVGTQVIFVNKQFIAVFWDDDRWFHVYNRIQPLWRRFIIGAMSGLIPEEETLLNFVDEVCVSAYDFSSSPFMGSFKHKRYANWTSGTNSGSFSTLQPTAGLLWKQPYDAVPVNKDNDISSNPRATVKDANPRWQSTIHYSEFMQRNHNRNTASNGGYWNTHRIAGSYADCVRYNVSMVRHFLHQPIVFLYEELDSVNVFLHPIAYLPYYAVRLQNMLVANDTITYGTDTYSVFPVLKNESTFGIALKFIEGN